MMGEGKHETREVFTATLALTIPKERGRYLDEVCRGKPELRQRVEALLRAHDQAGSFLEPTVPIPPPSDLQVEHAGVRIGRYKLLQEIGEGGFGQVFMAEQKEPVQRKVALKIIKAGMDTKEVVARFEAERQALALMDHPHIARVFDGGVTRAGRPYFVMELVRGVPITDYCDRNNLPMAGRLELFMQVCQAVQHAHQKAIIHRDLKPTNILVTILDGKPVPKIIDFGVAKALGQKLTEKTLFTAFEQIIGTPAYMSPEQAELSGMDVDTRSDIYALGVLLYELLTGVTPFDAETFRNVALDEVRRMIREQEPQKPSTRLRTLGDKLTEVAQHRHSEPSELPQLVHGDLDWIVMKALEKDRRRRYETAGALAEDLQRHLDHHPVLASPPGTLYRANKFVRRHRMGVALCASAAAALVAGLSVAVVGFVQASRERDNARQAQQRATLNFQMARNAVDEITRVAEKQLADFPGVDKVRRELLQKAQVFYDEFASRNKNDPAVKAEIAQAYSRVAQIHFILGNFTQQREGFGRAIVLLEELTAAYPSVPEYRVELADCWLGYANTSRRTHHGQESVPDTGKAVDLLEGLVADFPTEPEYRQRLAETYTRLGIALRDASQPKEAETQLRRALAMWEEVSADFPERPKDLGGLAHSHWWLGALLLDLGQLTEAEHELRVALELYEQQLANNPGARWLEGKFAHNRAYLAMLLLKQGYAEAAEQEYRQVIATREKLVAEFPDVFEYRRRLGHELRGLSEALMTNGCPKEAENVLRHAIAHQETIAAALPEGLFQWDVAYSLFELGGILSKTGRLEEAVAAYRRSIRIAERLVADFPREVTYIRKGLARVYLDCGHALDAMGRSDEAMQAYEQAKVIEAVVPSP